MPPYQHPMGLAIIAQVLIDAGHDVDILDLNCLRYTEKEVIENLPQKDYDFVGISGLITTYKYLNFLVPVIKGAYSQAKLVIGGGGFTSGYETYMENLRPDYGVIGEGEYTMLELVEGKPPEDILGLVYYVGNELVVNPPRPLEKNLDSFPMMAFDKLDMEPYVDFVRHSDRANREVAMIATRGCPMNCAFCYHVFGRGVRYRSVDNVLAEMEYLIDNYQVESFLFGDECFTARRSWIEEFCHKLIDKNWGVEWSCFSRVDTIKEETMELMAKAGCYWMGFGYESGSQKILDEMNKRTTVEQAKKSTFAAKKHFRQVHGTFIFGMPGEDDESIRENIEFSKEIVCLNMYFFLAPYPGTKVFYDNLDKILDKFGNLHNFFMALGDKDAGHFVINLTRWSDEVMIMKKSNMERKIKFAIFFRTLMNNIPKKFIGKHEIKNVKANTIDDAIIYALNTDSDLIAYVDDKKYMFVIEDVRELVRACECE
jgi:magnesium-protoporphyrin IX monomethyl ester (oxidative) cyclase